MDFVKSEKELLKRGWKKVSLGKKKSNNKIIDIEGFELYVRETLVGDFLKKSPKVKLANLDKSRVCDVGSNRTMGNPKGDLTPSAENIIEKEIKLPEIGNFADYASLRNIRPNEPCLLIAFDSEWWEVGYGRYMLSWQFSVIHSGKLIEFVFIKSGVKDLSLELALGEIFDYLELESIDVRKVTRYKACKEFNNKGAVVETYTDYKAARANSKYIYQNGEFIPITIDEMNDKVLPREERDWAWFHSYLDFKDVKDLKVTLLCHAGKVDISSFLEESKDIKKYLTEVQGGLVTLNYPITFTITSHKSDATNHKKVYPVKLSVRDTMCHAPAGKKSLKCLGDAIGVPKIDLSEEIKKNMRKLLELDPVQFFEYSSNDSIVTLLYASALYGYNNTPPITITSATAKVMKASIMKYLNIKNEKEFDRVYRGLVKVVHGKVKKDNKPGFVEASSLEPISDKANTVQHYASHAYHGGYNSCSEVGYFGYDTYDYDLKNAYPTAMCLVPDINWSDPIKFEIINRELTMDFWKESGGLNPLIPLIAYVRFEFPEDVKYPCIPVNVDGIPIFPRTSNGLDGVYACGPELYLALKLGAKVFCERGYILNTLTDADNKESRSLAYAVKQMIIDRDKAKAESKVKGQSESSLEEFILKLMVNSIYGKVAQNVIEKHTWSAYEDEMKALGCSAITNPVSACLITSIVRAELLAAQNQAYQKGYMTCSVTTDGFISNMPADVLKSLDLYGIRPFMETARLFLTDDESSEIWVAKHKQNDLINFTTRGNVSLLQGGVCAHNSTKSGYESDSYEDRRWLMTEVLLREGAVEYEDSVWTTFKDLVRGKCFTVTQQKRTVRMDYDMKRKPDRDSFKMDYPVVEGKTYEIAHFDTVPFDNVEEFRLYRKKMDLTKCLRTMADWDVFWNKINFCDCNKKIKDREWTILLSCVMGHRCGLWEIPKLNEGSVDEKCEWLNMHNDSTKTFKNTDWKNARRPERLVNMLPREFLEEKLVELGAIDVEYNQAS